MLLYLGLRLRRLFNHQRAPRVIKIDQGHRDAPLGHTVDFERTLDPCIFMATITPDSPSPQANPETVESINPLFDDPEADVVLRSRDSHTFRVLKLYIVRSSTVLGDMIRTASGSSNTGTGNVARNEEWLPEVQLCDNGTTLSSLLTFIFPVPPILPSTLEKTMELLSAAQKYEMNSVLTHIRGVLALQDPPFIRRDNAFLAYSLAQRYGLRKEVTQAARLTLKFTFTIESLEPGVVPGAYLHELWQYHKGFQALLSSDLSAFRIASLNTALHSLHCSQSAWVNTYVQSIITSPSLFDPIEFQMALMRHTTDTVDEEDGCSSCVNIPVDRIRTFWTALSTAVHRCMIQVSTVNASVKCTSMYSDTFAGRIRASSPSNGNKLSKSPRFSRRPHASARIPGYKRGGHHSTDIRSCQFPCPQVGTGLFIDRLQGYVYPPQPSDQRNGQRASCGGYIGRCGASTIPHYNSLSHHPRNTCIVRQNPGSSLRRPEIRYGSRTVLYPRCGRTRTLTHGRGLSCVCNREQQQAHTGNGRGRAPHSGPTYDI